MSVAVSKRIRALVKNGFRGSFAVLDDLDDLNACGSTRDARTGCGSRRCFEQREGNEDAYSNLHRMRL